jgi:hypothetical protein
MRWTGRRTFVTTVATVVATVVAAVLALAAPANAAYSTRALALPWHPTGPVHSTVSRLGTVYVGGRLDGTGGIATVDATTGRRLWHVSANGDVRALALSANGRILYAGGDFTRINGKTAPHVAAINVTNRTLVRWKGSALGQVRDLLIRGSTLYVAGKITRVDGVAQRGIGAINARTGQRVASFHVSADDNVLGLALAGNRLILSGSFTHINGVARNLLASVDVSTNTLTRWAPGKLCPSCDQYFDVQTDGTNAYVATSGNAAGAFSLTTGRQAWPIIRGTGNFQAVWVPGDGRVYYGGHFGTAIWTGSRRQDTVPATDLAAVFTANGRIDTAWTPRIYRTYPGCWAITSTPGKLWVGGDFAGERVNGTNNNKPYLAAYAAL